MVVLEEIEPVNIDPRPGAAAGTAGGNGGEGGGGDDDDMPPDIEEIPGSELSVPIKVWSAPRGEGGEMT